MSLRGNRKGLQQHFVLAYGTCSLPSTFTARPPLESHLTSCKEAHTERGGIRASAVLCVLPAAARAAVAVEAAAMASNAGGGGGGQRRQGKQNCSLGGSALLVCNG